MTDADEEKQAFDRIEKRIERLERDIDNFTASYKGIHDTIVRKKTETKIPARNTKFYDYLLMIYDECGDRPFTSRYLLKSGFETEDLHIVSVLNVKYHVFEKLGRGNERPIVRRIKPEVCERLSKDLEEFKSS